tara:strand:+ start:637 stop:1353 length:717 start_codon:yes stop_codon:yes gene_type:complete
MKLLKIIAVILFDLIDIYIHQKRIINFFHNRKILINYFVDVGAHKGSYTELILSSNKKCKIMMFEPQKKYFNIIEKKFKKFNSIKVFNSAVSYKKGKKILFINRHDVTSSLVGLNTNNFYLNLKARLFGTNAKGMISSKTKVNTVDLRSMLKKNRFKKVDLVKIDTEGHEYEVLKGLNKSIIHVKYILIEFHHNKIYPNYSPKKIHQYLIKNHFLLKQTYQFPLTTFEDRIYVNKLYK